MLEVTRSSASHTRDDAITRSVAEMVVSREPVTERQFDGVLAMVSAQIRKRFDLSQRGAEQAVRPVLRRLIPILVPQHGNRRTA